MGRGVGQEIFYTWGVGRGAVQKMILGACGKKFSYLGHGARNVHTGGMLSSVTSINKAFIFRLKFIYSNLRARLKPDLLEASLFPIVNRSVGGLNNVQISSILLK
jgi:hypothetical protein